MKKSGISLLIILLATLVTFGQHANVLITKNSPIEPTIIINPNSTNELYVGINGDRVYYSTDGGYTWTEQTLISTYGVRCDPCMLCDTAGAFYNFHLSIPDNPFDLDRIVCQKTSEPGGEWNNGTFTGLNIPRAQDKEWATLDWKNNNIYVTWTQFYEYSSSNPDCLTDIMFSKSMDAGMTWSHAIKINEISGNCMDSDSTVEGAVPAVGPNGEIYVSWMGPAGLVFDRSLDQGATWLANDIYVSEIPGGWDMSIPGIFRANGFPVTACDVSGGPYNGNIYINFADQRNGPDDTDIWLVKSTDGGNTWSDPIRVNNDPPGRQQFLTWMAIDQTNGYLYFVFYDRRNFEPESVSTDVYMARSMDGGQTFENFKISEKPFVPLSKSFLGDYTNVTAHNNVIRPVWASVDEEGNTLYTAIINTDLLGIEEDKKIVPFSVENSYPNPFRESTWISFKTMAAAPVSLIVYDQLGRPVDVILNHSALPAGKHAYQFDASGKNLSSGVYYFYLVIKDRVKQQKIILNRE
jgi:hypothetical protein